MNFGFSEEQELLRKTMFFNYVIKKRGEITKKAKVSPDFQVSKEIVEDFRKFVYAEGQAFLEKVDAWLTAAEIPEQEKAGSGAQRIGVGLYWIQSGEATE